MTEGEEIARMRGEIDAIDSRINHAWEGIKTDIARKEWLRQQIIRKSTYVPDGKAEVAK